MTNPTTYQKLIELSTKATLFQGIAMTLSWDQETKMPQKAIEIRSKQHEVMASLVHQERTSRDFADTLGSLIDLETGSILASDLSDAQQAALREWRRDYVQAVKLPSSFVEEFAKATSDSMHAWKEAKGKNDFSSFLPHLEKIVELSRQKADILGYEEHPYNALVDEYEPEMTTGQLIPLFKRLKDPLKKLLKNIEAKPKPDDSFLHQPYPHNQQIAFGKKILAAMGFDKSFSRLDESSHPMCMGLQPLDVRLTTRVNPQNPLPNLLSAIHEGGHGLYEGQLPLEHYGTPLCQAASLGIHESQSRMWETILGRSLPFWKHFFPLLQSEYPDQLGNVALEDFHRAINIVKPSMIRVDSDEVTYNLHIMLRFELELALLEGKLEPKNLPEAWNAKMEEYLGITPKTNAEGCMQDIHWSMGGIGYFPTYTLGNLYAAQFFSTFAEAHPNWENQVENGELASIGKWLKENIHQHGRRYLPADLCEKVTGSPLSEAPFVNYLEKKYTKIYNL